MKKRRQVSQLQFPKAPEAIRSVDDAELEQVRGGDIVPCFLPGRWSNPGDIIPCVLPGPLTRFIIPCVTPAPYIKR